MNNKTTFSNKSTLFCMEAILVFLIFAGIATQVIFSKAHMLFLLLRMLYVPGMVFLAGMYASEYRHNAAFLFRKSGGYALLYLIFGCCNLVLLQHKLPFRSLVRLAAFLEVPRFSEMFFTSAVLFFCCALIAGSFSRIFEKKKLLIPIGILAPLFCFFPDNLFGYPIIGVFTDCNTYSCIPLLPYLGFFIVGMFLHHRSVEFDKKVFLKASLCTVVGCALYITPLKQIGLIVASALPIYVLYLFSNYCRIFHRFIELIGLLCKTVHHRLRRLFSDFMNNKREVLPLYFVVYTVLFAFTACCVFFSFIEYGNSIAWTHDPIAQYIPRIYYFSDYIRACASKLLHGDLQFASYTFRSGLGNSVPLTFEPVYWLFALFDSSHVESAYNILTIFRFFLAGLSASILFLYNKKGYLESLIGSMMYTFCGFAIYAGVLHAHFIAPMIFLPLLVLSTEEIFRKKRWYLCTIVVAVALMSNYYFIYMSTIAMGIYYIGRFLFTKNKEQKTWSYFLTTTLTFAGAYLLGVIIGNISLFTSFASYMSSGRSGSTALQTMSLFFYKDTWLLRLFTYYITLPGAPGAWLKLGFIPLSYLAVVVLFMKKKNHFLKFLFLVCVTFATFPIAGLILSGFNAVTNRWCYILALTASFITVCAISEFRNLTRRELKIMFFALIPYIVIILGYRDYRTTYGAVSLAVLLCNYIVILCMNKEMRVLTLKAGKCALLILCCIALGLNGYYQYLLDKNTSPTSFAKRGEVLNTVTDTPMKVFDHYKDDSFYRVTTPTVPRKNLSSSLVMNYNSISTFSSTINGSIINYNCAMGNTAWNLVQLEGFDNRTFLNELASVKYYSAEEKQKAQIPYNYKEIKKEKHGKKTYYIYENTTPLSLGYTYDSVISESELDKYSPLERQEIMLQTAVVDDHTKAEYSSLSSGTPSSTAAEIKITDIQAKDFEFKDGIATAKAPGASLTLTFDGDANAETYLVFDGQCDPTSNNDEYVAKTKITCGDYHRDYSFRSSNHTYYTGQDVYLFNLGYRKASAHTCTITFENKASFHYNSLKVYCQPMDNYSAYIQNLSSDSLENVTFDANTISGSISVDSEKLLALSIPYQKGWTAYVDGKKTKLLKTNLMYTGIALDAGRHDIRLVYERPGLKASLCLTLAGLVIFAIALIIRHRRIRIKRSK